MVRFGSCGVVHDKVDVGDIIVPESAIMIQQNFFDETSGPFLISKPCPGDKPLTDVVVKELQACSGSFFKVATGGIDASSDSFYASQGFSPNLLTLF